MHPRGASQRSHTKAGEQHKLFPRFDQPVETAAQFKRWSRQEEGPENPVPPPVLYCHAAPSNYVCSKTRMRMAASWALVAPAWGERVVLPVPLTTPLPQAHWKAGMAHSDTAKAS